MRSRNDSDDEGRSCYLTFNRCRGFNSFLDQRLIVGQRISDVFEALCRPFFGELSDSEKGI